MSNLNIIPRKEICKQIGVSRDTLKNWIRKRNFPKPLNSSGREPLFDELCVKEWQIIIIKIATRRLIMENLLI